MSTYTFTINGAGQANCKLHKGENEVKSELNEKPLAKETWGIFWIDFRSNNLILGAGAKVIFQFSDSSFTEVGYISFNSVSETHVRLCNRQGRVQIESTFFKYCFRQGLGKLWKVWEIEGLVLVIESN